MKRTVTILLLLAAGATVCLACYLAYPNNLYDSLPALLGWGFFALTVVSLPDLRRKTAD